MNLVAQAESVQLEGLVRELFAELRRSDIDERLRAFARRPPVQGSDAILGHNEVDITPRGHDACPRREAADDAGL